MTERLCDGLQNHRDGFDSRPYVHFKEIIMLNHISTSIIILELRNRINDQLKDPEPQYDAVLSELKHNDLLILDLALPIFTTPEPEEV